MGRLSQYRLSEPPKGRSRNVLTEADIPLIRQLLAEGMSASAVARKFEVCNVTILNIGKGKTWKQA